MQCRPSTVHRGETTGPAARAGSVTTHSCVADQRHFPFMPHRVGILVTGWFGRASERSRKFLSDPDASSHPDSGVLIPVRCADGSAFLLHVSALGVRLGHRAEFCMGRNFSVRGGLRMCLRSSQPVANEDRIPWPAADCLVATAFDGYAISVMWGIGGHSAGYAFLNSVWDMPCGGSRDPPFALGE
jgi:hypothetical protein